VPEELRTSADDAVNLTETQVQEWEQKFNQIKTASEAEHQKILQEQREADRQLIATALQQTLENLGYEVDTIQHSMFVEGGRFYATRPEWKGHFVEISGTIEGDDDRLKSRCVRTRQADERMDSQVDKKWCDDIHKGMKQLRDDGIELDIDRVDLTAPLVATLTDQEIVKHPQLHPTRKKQTSHAVNQAMPIPGKE